MYRNHLNLKLNYYSFKAKTGKLAIEKNSKIGYLKFQFQKKKDGYISEHSGDFNYTMKFNN